MLSLPLLLAINALSVAATPIKRWSNDHSQCRFSPQYSQDDILSNPEPFIWDMLYWEGQFHQNDIGYNVANGMTYDGTLINTRTGMNNVSEKHVFSAASKEALQIMVYAQALTGNPYAGRFVSPDDHTKGADKAAEIMKTKLDTYLRFNTSYPGFGGMLPWFYSNETDIRPTFDWNNRIPALDNGELLWAVYAAVGAMETSGRQDWKDLAAGWSDWLDYTKITAKKIFYDGKTGVCAVVLLNQTLSPFDPAQNITCSAGNPATLNDPYEGELATWWIHFYGDLTQQQKDALWENKRPQLRSVEYSGSVVNTPFDQTIAANYSGLPVVSEKIGPITVQEGYWFSAHEQWKLLQMPYDDHPLVKRISMNAERVRTCNSVLMGQNAGMYASINNVTDPTTGQIEGSYISYAGVPSVAVQTTQELDIITPYATFPVIFQDKKVGLAWYKNLLDAQAMQNPYGSTESIRRDGNAWSSFVSWDSKILSVAALLGGSVDPTREKMKREGIYDEFYAVIEREHSAVFGNGLKGEDLELCLPNYKVPQGAVKDYTECTL